LIREVDAFIEKPGGKELSEAIHEKFKALKEFLGKDPPASMEERKQQKEVWDREMAELAEQFKFTELKKPVIAKHFDQTFLKFESETAWETSVPALSRMEPTNNLSEQVIREHGAHAEDHRCFSKH